MMQKGFISAFLFLVLLVISAGVYQKEVQYRVALEDLVSRTQMIADFSYPFIVHQNRSDLQKTMGKLSQFSSPRYLIIVGSEGTIFFSSSRMDLVDQILPDAWIPSSGSRQIIRKYENENVIETRLPIVADSSQNNGNFGYVILGISESVALKPIETYFRFFLFIGFFGVFCLSVAVYLLNRNFQKAFDYFKTQIASVASGQIAHLSTKRGDPRSWQTLVLHINQILKQFEETRTRLEESQRTAAIVETASQVAHDIRSPLTSLTVVSKDIAELPENKRILIRSAVGRINDIANHLITQSRAILSEPNQIKRPAIAMSSSNYSNSYSDETILIQTAIDSIVSEKRIQYLNNKSIEIETEFNQDAYGLFSAVYEKSLMRVLSNLIDNAAEALNGHGRVVIKLSRSHNEATVTVEDTGKGIPAEMLPKLGYKGVSYDKQQGTGLGLYTAKALVQDWGGRLQLSSELRKGTQVTFTLPIVPTPPWFISEISVFRKEFILILDDDKSIHQVWNQRLEWISPSKVLHFLRLEDLEKWIEEHRNHRNCLYFVDYELNENRETGLDLIEKYRLSHQAILVTSYFEDFRIQQRCVDQGVRILPKSLANSIPILR